MTSEQSATAAATELDAEPMACTCHRSGAPHSKLQELLAVRSGGGTQPCQWRIASLDVGSSEELSETACILADWAMRYRFRGAQANYRLWRNAVIARRALSDVDRRKVTPFVRTVFGEPEAPPPIEHLCGWVAEFLWYCLAHELDRPGNIRRQVEGPDFHATAPGGDGLAVWQREADGTLTFCLWEIKNHTGESPITGTIGRAYTQLNERATEYLAKLTGVATTAEHDPEMRKFYSELVNLWVDGSDQAGVGVAVGTHNHLAPRRCFTTMHSHFPALQGNSQLEGLIAAIARFDDLARMVQERVWIAL